MPDITGSSIPDTIINVIHVTKFPHNSFQSMEIIMKSTDWPTHILIVCEWIEMRGGGGVCVFFVFFFFKITLRLLAQIFSYSIELKCENHWVHVLEYLPRKT